MYSLYSIFIFLILFFSITIKWVLFSVLFYTNYDIPSLCMHLYFTFAIIIKCVYLPSYFMFILCLFYVKYLVHVIYLLRSFLSCISCLKNAIQIKFIFLLFY